jgi:hypothetical protein
MTSSTPDPLPEEKPLRWALALERMSVGWNLLVSVIAVIVGNFASSLALLASELMKLRRRLALSGI